MIGESPTRRVAASPYRRVATYALASLALVTPCFWQARIQAGDLGSHLYNAWLAQLVEKGQAPGATIAPQWSNMLFDLALSGIFKLGGARLAERAAVSLAGPTFSRRGVSVARWETVWWSQQRQYVTGVDEWWVYGPQYFLLQPALLLLWAIWLTRVIRRRGWMRITASVPLGVWLLTAVVVAVIPSRI